MTEAPFAVTRSGASAQSVSDPGGPTGWGRWTSFASTMMTLIGCFQLVQGLVAVVNEEYLLVRERGLVLDVDYDVWGWTYMALGALVIAAAVGLLFGQVWARVVGVVLAGLSALLNFTFLAAYPAWSLIVITVDVFVILALTVHGKAAQAS